MSLSVQTSIFASEDHNTVNVASVIHGDGLDLMDRHEDRNDPD